MYVKLFFFEIRIFIPIYGLHTKFQFNCKQNVYFLITNKTNNMKNNTQIYNTMNILSAYRPFLSVA